MSHPSSEYTKMGETGNYTPRGVPKVQWEMSMPEKCSQVDVLIQGSVREIWTQFYKNSEAGSRHYAWE